MTRFHNDLGIFDLIQKCLVTDAVQSHVLKGLWEFEDYFFGNFTVSCGVLAGFIWITLLQVSLVKEQYTYQGNMLLVGLRFSWINK